MTAEEKKMTHESAKEIVARVDNMEEAAGRFNNLADLGSRYWIAKGFLLGRESGIRESVQVCIGLDGSGAYAAECAEEILALLPDGREKEKP